MCFYKRRKSFKLNLESGALYRNKGCEVNMIGADKKQGGASDTSIEDAKKTTVVKEDEDSTTEQYTEVVFAKKLPKQIENGIEDDETSQDEAKEENVQKVFPSVEKPEAASGKKLVKQIESGQALKSEDKKSIDANPQDKAKKKEVRKSFPPVESPEPVSAKKSDQLSEDKKSVPKSPSREVCPPLEDREPVSADSKKLVKKIESTCQ